MKGFIHKNDNHMREERERGREEKGEREGEGGERRWLELEVCRCQECNMRHKNQPTARLGQEQDHPYGIIRGGEDIACSRFP
jgi:hypothetical protein